MNEEFLWNYFICPNCKNKLEKGFLCKQCNTKYSKEKGVINLLPKNLNKEEKSEIKRFSKSISKKVDLKIFESIPTVKNFNETIKPEIEKKKLKILDIGSGAVVIGRLFKNINKKSIVFACDLSKERLEDVDIFEKYGQVDFKVLATINNLPFKNETFDYIIGSSILHHTKNLDSFISEIKRVLKKGGKYIGFNEPFGNSFLKKLQDQRFKGLTEVIRTKKDYEEIFKKYEFSNKIRIVENMKYQKPSHKLLYIYYMMIKLLPKNLKEKLGGNLTIQAKK